MANETELRDRWGRIYKDSAEYQTALKRDAIARSRGEANAREAMRLALRSGDTRKASAIQQQLLDDQAQSAIGAGGGEAAGLYAYQNKRVTDYIAQATQDRAKEYASPTRSFVDQAPAVPDFSTHYPYAAYRPQPDRFMVGGRVGRGGPSVQEPPDVLDNGQPVPTPEMLKWAMTDAQRAAVAGKRKEEQFVSSLPSNLREAFPKYSEGMTPEERYSFWNENGPEARYAKIHGYIGKNTPSTPGKTQTGSIVPTGAKDYLEPGSGLGLFIGTGGVSPMPAISRPLATTRPFAAVQSFAMPKTSFNMLSGATNY